MRNRLVHVLLALACGSALAQPPPGWPSSAIRIVVPFTPGSATDILARTLSERLTPRVGQRVIVENRPGASTTIGAAVVAKSDPDGYTLLVTSSAHTVAPFLYPDLPYDTERDLAGVAPLARLPTVLVVPPERGYRSVQDLVAAGKANPGSINYASAAASTQLNAERFRRSAGFEAVHIPYRGSPEALRAVMSGRVDFYFAPIAPALPLLREGKVVALAIGSSERAAALPDLPTTLEAGYPDSDYNFWIGAFAAGKTPRKLVDRLHREISGVMRQPAVRERVSRLGAEPMSMTPRRFDAHVRDELRANEVLVKQAGIKG